MNDRVAEIASNRVVAMRGAKFSKLTLNCVISFRPANLLPIIPDTFNRIF